MLTIVNKLPKLGMENRHASTRQYKIWVVKRRLNKKISKEILQALCGQGFKLWSE